MIRILDKYIIRCFLAPLVYCLVAFILLFIIGDLFENLDDFLQIPNWLPVMLRYYALFIPSIFVYITAIAILLALLYSLGRLQKHNEISAMRSGGISIYRITFPLLVLSLIFSLVVLYLNENVAPETMKQTNLLKEKQLQAGVAFNEVLKDVIFYNPMSNRGFHLESFETRSTAASGITIHELRADGTTVRRISARKGVWRNGSWWLSDGSIFSFPRNRPPEKEDFAKREFADLEVRPEDLRESFQEMETLSWRELKLFLDRRKGFPESTLRPARIALNQKIAMPLACLIMGLIGISFGLRIGKGGMLAGVGISLVLGFLYYVLYSLAVAFGKQGYLPAWLGAWMGNIVFGITGIVMLVRLK